MSREEQLSNKEAHKLFKQLSNSSKKLDTAVDGIDSMKMPPPPTKAPPPPPPGPPPPPPLHSPTSQSSSEAQRARRTAEPAALLTAIQGFGGIADLKRTVSAVAHIHDSLDFVFGTHVTNLASHPTRARAATTGACFEESGLVCSNQGWIWAETRGVDQQSPAVCEIMAIS